ncbi:MAG: DUF371 domain-containing protein [Deltaproteobacteria bacterium]|nr:DUF371 domain-containing protein [Deltaproteobacteria bacterium]
MEPAKGIDGRPKVRFRCRGHRNLRATHSKTLEFTHETEIGPRATCVVGVGADYDPLTVAKLRGPLEVSLRLAPPLESLEESFQAVANPLMKTSSSLVFRRSQDLLGNTFATETTLGAADLDRRLITALGRSETILEVEIRQRENAKPNSRGDHPRGSLIVFPLAPEATTSGAVLQHLPALDTLITPEPKTLRRFCLGSGDEEIVRCRGREDLPPLISRLRGGDRLGLAVQPAHLVEGSPALELIRQGRDSHCVVVALGFPSPGLTALMSSGIAAQPALFLPPSLGRRDLEPWLELLGTAKTTLVWPSSSARLRQTLARLDTLCRDQSVVVVGDPGGRREIAWRGSAAEILEALGSSSLGPESIFIVVGPIGEGGLGSKLSPSLVAYRPFLLALLEEGVHVRTLAKSLARATSASQKEAYSDLLRLRQSDGQD